MQLHHLVSTVCNVECKNDKILFTMEDCNGRKRKYLYSIHKIDCEIN